MKVLSVTELVGSATNKILLQERSPQLALLAMFMLVTTQDSTALHANWVTSK